MTKINFKRLSFFTAAQVVKACSHLTIILLLVLCSLWIMRAPLVEWLARQPLPNDWAVELTGLKSPSITHWQWKELTLKQAGAIYFTLKDVDLHWSPALLWQKKLLIKSLGIQSATFYQPPSQPAPSSSKTLDLTQLPSVALNRLQIEHLAFIDPATQTYALNDYALNGDFNLLWGDTLLTLNAQLTNQQAETIARVSTHANTPNQWSIQADVNEPAGGSLGKRLTLPAEQPLKAKAQIDILFIDNRYQINVAQLDFPWQNQQIKSQGTLWVNKERTLLEVPELVLSSNEHQQRIQALLTPEDQQITARLEQFPLGLVSAWLPFEEGSASGEFKLYWHKALRQLTLDANAELITRYQGWPLRLRGTINYSPQGLLSLNNTQADWGDGPLKSTIKASGVLDIKGDQNDLTLSSNLFTDQHLAKLPIQWLNQPQNRLSRELHALKFSAQVAKLSLQGPLKDPLITYDLDSKTQWQNNSFNLHLAGQGDVRGARLQNSQVQQADGSINLNGRLDWQGGGNNLSLRATNWGEAFWPTYQLNQLAALNTRINGEAQLTGTLAAPIINSQLTASGQLPLREPAEFKLLSQARIQYQFSKPWPQSVNLLSADTITLAINDKPRFTLNGSATPKALDLTLNCAEWNQELNQLLGLPLAPGSGNFSLSLTGSPRAPQVNGQWFYEIPVNNNAPLKWRGLLTTQRQDLTINSDVNEGDTNLATVQGRYPFNNLFTTKPLDAKLSITAKLAASRLLFDARRYPISGDLKADVSLSGDTQAPQLEGNISLSDGSFADKLLGLELNAINLNLSLDKNQLKVDKGEARNGSDGKLNLTGGCTALIPTSSCQLKLALQSLRIIRNRQIEAEASGDILTTLNERQLAITGALTLSPTTLMLTNYSSSSIKELVVEEMNKRGQDNNSFWPSPLIDVRWQLGSNSQVRGRGLEAQVAGTLHTQGPLNQLAYMGNFYTTKGSMELFNKRFILDTGEIRLAPGQIYLDMPAHYQSRVNSGEDLTIQARLQGDLNQLNLDLRSTPTLPPDEVLARLIFGKRIETITPFEGLQLAAAVNQLRSGDGFNLLDSTRSLLGVDRLKIDSEKNTDGSTGVNVGVGKYISDRVYVEIQRTPNPNTPWQGQIEVELTPSVNFESNTGQNGQGGAKLLWRRDY